jgi:predicted lipoprotein with Yx(FWY)xxD motif
MRPMSRSLVVVACAIACTASAQMPAGVKSSGNVLTNAAGMTLYTFDKDAGEKSVCNAQCAALWPPLAAPADASVTGDWKVITRDDGSRQWAYKGKPLYLWVKDQKPGDTTGDNVNNVWHVARP